jgi:hypothetical protein
MKGHKKALVVSQGFLLFYHWWVIVDYIAVRPNLNTVNPASVRFDRESSFFFFQLVYPPGAYLQWVFKVIAHGIDRAVGPLLTA